MIGAIGKKRFVAGFLLLAVNALMAASVYAYLMPENDRLERDVRGLRSQISAKRADSDRLRMEHQQIQEQKNYFENLGASGFFSDQNRVLARNKIEAVQRYAGVLSARYNISAAKVVKNDLAAGTGYALVSSPVVLNLEAMDDVDIFSFIFWLENAFPGQVSIDDVHIERVLDISDVTLRQIGSGVETVLIKSKVSFNWYTMMPEEVLGLTGEGGNGM